MKNLKTELKCFKALSEPLRIQLLQVIHQEQEVCVCVLTERFNLSQSKLSYHLKLLLEAGLINVYSSGKWNFYSINMHNFAQLLTNETIKKIFTIEKK